MMFGTSLALKILEQYFLSDDAKGCKILLTFIFEWVLGSDMGVDENFAIGLLSPNKTWDQFQNIVGDDLVNDNEFQFLGKEIVNECGCLPIAIKIIALEMKGCNLSFWSDSLNQLRRSNIKDMHEMHDRNLCFFGF